MRLSILGVIVAVALAASAGAQESRVDSAVHFGMVAIVNGVETARVNAALANPLDLQAACPITIIFIDGRGDMIGDPNTKSLQGFAIDFTDFIGDPGLRPGVRVPIRATVTIGDPGIHPACGAGVLLTMEIFDRFSRFTRLVLQPNPVLPPSPVTPVQ
jgi:hypothetical protein